MEPTARARHLPPPSSTSGSISGSNPQSSPADPADPITTTTTGTSIDKKQPTLAPYKAAFLKVCLDAQILRFGSFTLKSGRISPYFFNTALFHKARLVSALATAYAEALIAYSGSDSESSDGSGGEPLEFDVLFGPAYKGIPLAATTVVQLAEIAPARFEEVSFSFNRKEAKDHGEGGTVVGAGLQGKRVVIIDDVVTAGTAKREAVELIRAQGGTVVGIVVALDRMEKLPADASKGEDDEDGIARGSAIGALRREYGVPIVSVITLEDLIQGLRDRGEAGEASKCEEYWKKYRASD